MRFPLRRRVLMWSGLCLVMVMLLITWKSLDRNSRLDAYHKKKAMLFNGLINQKDVAVHLRSDAKQSEYIDKKGVHVVVGRYVGNSLPDTNLTRDELNANRFNPEPGVGENGEAAFVKASEKTLSKRLWHINKFNIVISDKIALNRSLPDVRKPLCRAKTYDLSTFSDVSIIIVFHNEAWSTLFRTIHSVINRSPIGLIKEIILVDDCSDRSFLKRDLEVEVDKLNVEIKIVRNEKRLGLIQARLKGATLAQGDVLVFLDAHCETTKGWLEPLLDRIQESPNSVVCPVIDIINDDNFAYTKSFALHWGAFNWALHFRWFTMSQSILEEFKKDVSHPYRTPVMAGGLFAMRRDFFYQIGGYDDLMDIWGGENLELSFRVWMCGGSVEIAPCSHVGHIFRRASPYTFPRDGGVGGVLHANLARVALVWMDEMADFYFKLNPFAAKAGKKQNVDKRKELRKRLKCHSFQWYLDNVWPEHFFPTSGRKLGWMKHRNSGMCLQKPFRTSESSVNQPSGPAILEECSQDSLYIQQLLVMSEKGFLMADENVCLDSPSANEDEATVRFQACSESDRQRWTYDEKNKVLVHRQTQKCLSHPTAGTSDIVTLQKCSGKVVQQWVFEDQDWRDF